LHIFAVTAVDVDVAQSNMQKNEIFFFSKEILLRMERSMQKVT